MAQRRGAAFVQSNTPSGLIASMRVLDRTRRLACTVVATALVSGCAAMPFREPTREEVLDRILPASVQVLVEDGGRQVRAGSGVAIASRATADGRYCFVLTSGHLLSGTALSGGTRDVSGNGRDSGIIVRFGEHDRRERKSPAKILAWRDAGAMDLALLRTRDAAGATMPA